MKEFVISCLSDGSVQYTRNKGIFDLDGIKEVERVSDIRFTSSKQKYYIFWLRGPYALHPMFLSQWTSHHTGKPPVKVTIVGDWLLFDTYEDAVEVEVMMLNAMRLKGTTF